MSGARLKDRTALITGGTRGIGRSLIDAFVAEGAAVCWTGASPESIAEAAETMPRACRDRGIAADLREPEAVRSVVSQALERLGHLDVLVNNAGVTDAAASPWESTVEDWDYVMAVNVRAPFIATMAAAESLARNGRGSVIMMGSIAAQVGGAATGPAYVASKSGIEGLTRSLARQLAARGIRVNCLAPSGLETDMVAQWSDEARRRVAAMALLARLGRPEEAAGAAIYLASDESSFVTGQTLNINGGAYMG